jgi:hypothetical protein
MKEEKEEPSMFDQIKDTYILICISNMDEILKVGSDKYYDEKLQPAAVASGVSEDGQVALKKLFDVVFESTVTVFNKANE